MYPASGPWGWRDPQQQLWLARNYYEKEGARRAAGAASFLVLGSTLLMSACMAGMSLLLRLSGQTSGDRAQLLSYLASCLSYLSLAVIPLLYLFRQQNSPSYYLPFAKPRAMGLRHGEVLLLSLAAMGLVLASNLPVDLVSWLLEQIQLPSGIPDMPLDETAGTQIFYMLYGTLIPPLVEELLFRGVAIGVLRRWGGTFAVVVSALLFGLYHGNIQQFVFAFLVGLILGWLRLRTGSLLPCMGLHMLNNGLSNFSSLLRKWYGGEAAGLFIQIYFMAFLALGLAAGVWLLLRHRGSLRLPPEPRAASSLGTRVSGFVRSAGGLLMLVYGVLNSLLVLLMQANG